MGIILGGTIFEIYLKIDIQLFGFQNQKMSFFLDHVTQSCSM